MDRDPGPPPFARILAPVDGSPASEIAVRRSQALLTLPGCRLTLLHVGGESERLRRVENLASEVRRWGTEATVREREGRPAGEILREIESGEHDLVLMTSRRRSLVARSLPGNVTLGVLRQSPEPLLLYRPLAGLDESFFAVDWSESAKFRRLILMLDGSEPAEAVIGFSHRLARAFGSELILFQSLSPAEITESRMESVRAYLAERAEEAAHLGISVRIEIPVGDPAAGAIRLLKGGAGTIALTTRGCSFWRSTFLGSVAQRVLRIAEGPILCVSSHGVRRGDARRIGTPHSHPVAHGDA